MIRSTPLYEYIEEGDNTEDIVRQSLEFFWRTGFSFTISPLWRNWKSGILVDLSDVVQIRGYGWKQAYYGRKAVEDIIETVAGDEPTQWSAMPTKNPGQSTDHGEA